VITHQKKAEWKFIAAGWTVYAVYMAIASYVISARLGRPISWLSAVVNDFSYSAIWLLLTPAILLLANKYKFEKGRILSRFVIHLIASVFLSFAQKGIHWLVVAMYELLVLHHAFSWDPLYRNLLAFYDYGLQLYWIVLAVYYVAEYYTRYRTKEVAASQLEAQLARAQLQALKMQLHPHFLFNALHTIAGLVRSDEKQKAVKMIAGLSDLLRTTLDTTDEQEVTLQSELETVKKYLDIEQVRFADCLTTEFHVDPTTLDALVPNLILQPLVENAIRHGTTSNTITSGCHIAISSIRTNGTLKLEVRDNGSGLVEGMAQRKGIGLSNTKARLERLYGDRQELEISNAPGGGVLAKIQLPWHTSRE
jgi:two-component system, LytTR family, sensor kinase